MCHNCHNVSMNYYEGSLLEQIEDYIVNVVRVLSA